MPRIFLGIWYIRSYLILVAIYIYPSISPLGTAFGYGSELSNQRMDALCGIDHMVFTFGSNRSEGFPIVFEGNMATSSLKKVSFPNSPDTLRGVSLKTTAAFTDICIFSYVLFVLSLVSFRPFLLFFFLFPLSSLCL